MVAKGPTGLSTFSRLLAAFGVFLLGYMIVAVGRPVALAMKAAAEAAATRARSVVQPAQGSACLPLSPGIWIRLPPFYLLLLLFHLSRAMNPPLGGHSDNGRKQHLHCGA